MTEDRQAPRGRLTLLLIVAAFALPIIIAAWLYQTAREEGVWNTTNHGILIQPPRALEAFSLSPINGGSPFTLEDLEGQWTLVYAPPSNCDEDCRRAIYHMRQVWRALGREAPRVQRLMRVGPDSDWGLSVKQEYPGLIVVRDTEGSRALLDQLTVEDLRPRRHFYLIDPLGNLMMAFPLDLDPGGMLDDIKKLLKISKIG